jgi:hypothetical protein
LSSKWRDLVCANAHKLTNSKNETAEILRSMDFFLSALVENDSGKRPTGGFGRLLSSEAVGEAGHFAKILLPGAADGKDAFSEFRA